jgi:hypothetical protein
MKRYIQCNTMPGTARNSFPPDLLVTLDHSPRRSLRAQLALELHAAPGQP